MASINYNVDDLKTNSKNLLNEYGIMNDAVSALNDLTSSFTEHWAGDAQAAYLGFFTERIQSLSSYLAELQVIANNLNTAADYYEKHEEHYSASLW